MGSHSKTQHTRINQSENNTITQNLQDKKNKIVHIYIYLFKFFIIEVPLYIYKYEIRKY